MSLMFAKSPNNILLIGMRYRLDLFGVTLLFVRHDTFFNHFWYLNG